MLMSIATVSISGSLDAKLRAIHDAGFAGVEIFENDLLTYGGSARVVGQQMRDLGLVCTCFQPFRDFEGMPPENRARVFDRVERKFDVMQDLGADLLLVCSNVSPVSRGERSRIVDDFRELGVRAAARGLRVGYEALAWGRHINDHRDVWSIVKQVNHPAIGMILDSFHSLSRNIPIESLREIDPRKVFLVQLADAPILQMELLQWSRHFRNMPGQGDFPLVDYVAALFELGCDCPLSLEIFNDRFRAASAATVAVDGRRSLTHLVDGVERKLRNVVPDRLPPRVNCTGVEFVEFAANETEAVELGKMFGALGFAKVGQHRNKDVARWQQNGINFVINSEPESFARSYDNLHGASVCALGLSVVDIDAAMLRAKRLQIPLFHEPVGPGELRMPSIHGVGDSLVYFMESGAEDQIWKEEFVLESPREERRDAGLLRVDYVAQTMQYEEMLSWLLFYVSLFDVSKTTQLEIPDPLGLVYSQPVQSADGALRILLNGSASAQTLSARFLQGYMGAGVQHIALATDDIFHTAERLRESGLPMLSIPQNYYDDLEARFGLDEALVTKLAEYGILYDREGNGEYFQMYTRAFAKRFFFEIVQRRDYGAYGAPNVAVRLAAQSRYRNDPPQ
jgi:4-hydroxyphenylpyruvate dioxygenase